MLWFCKVLISLHVLSVSSATIGYAPVNDAMRQSPQCAGFAVDVAHCGSIGRPCIIAIDHKPCGQCVKLNLTTTPPEDETESGCEAGNCSPFKQSIYAVVGTCAGFINGPAGQVRIIGENAWESVCPSSCIGSSDELCRLRNECRSIPTQVRQSPFWKMTDVPEDVDNCGDPSAPVVVTAGLEQTVFCKGIREATTKNCGKSPSEPCSVLSTLVSSSADLENCGKLYVLKSSRPIPYTQFPCSEVGGCGIVEEAHVYVKVIGYFHTNNAPAIGLVPHSQFLRPLCPRACTFYGPDEHRHHCVNMYNDSKACQDPRYSTLFEHYSTDGRFVDLSVEAY